MAKLSKRALLANSFGTIGYLSSLLLWTWVAILYLPAFLENERVRDFLIPSDGQKVVPTDVSNPSSITIAVALIFSFIIMAVTIAVLVRLPVTIAKTGKAVTTKAAISLEPLITHGREIPPKEKRQLTTALVKLIKLSLVLVPIIGCYVASMALSDPLPPGIAIVVTTALGINTLVWFTAQYVTAAVLDIIPDKLV